MLKEIIIILLIVALIYYYRQNKSLELSIENRNQKISETVKWIDEEYLSKDPSRNPNK